MAKKHPIIEFIFEEIIKQDLYINGVAEVTSLTPTALYSWRNNNRTPRLNSLEEVLNVLGYTLTIKERKK
jgi:hypothetical protein